MVIRSLLTIIIIDFDLYIFLLNDLTQSDHENLKGRVLSLAYNPTFSSNNLAPTNNRVINLNIFYF